VRHASIAPEIYREGGLYDDELRHETTTSAGVGRRVAELFPAYEIRRPAIEFAGASPAFEAHVRSLYAHIDRHESRGAASVLVELDDVLIAHDILYVRRGGERTVVYETHRKNDRPYTRLLSSPERMLARALPARDELALYLGSVGSSNWGHFLCDDLPRLRAIDELRARHPGETITIVLPRGGSLADERRQEAIALLLGGDRLSRLARVELVDRRIPRRYRRLYYASPVTHHPILKSPAALAWARGALASETVAPRDTASPFGRKVGQARDQLFVTRRAARGRRLTNEAEVADWLTARGFVTFDPEGASAREQLAAFSRASIVVGTMGAGLANALACAPGARLVPLAPDGWVEPFYWDLAAACGLDYRPCYGATTPSSAPPHERPFAIRVDDLAKIVDA
jgi:hypothetical protein